MSEEYDWTEYHEKISGPNDTWVDKPHMTFHSEGSVP